MNATDMTADQKQQLVAAYALSRRIVEDVDKLWHQLGMLPDQVDQRGVVLAEILVQSHLARYPVHHTEGMLRHLVVDAIGQEAMQVVAGTRDVEDADLTPDQFAAIRDALRQRGHDGTIGVEFARGW